MTAVEIRLFGAVVVALAAAEVVLGLATALLGVP